EGLGSGGPGRGFSVPLACAIAVVGTSNCANSNAPAHRAILRRGARPGASILVMQASDREFRRPRGAVRPESPRVPRRRVPRGILLVKRNAAGKVTNYRHRSRL